MVRLIANRPPSMAGRIRSTMTRLVNASGIVLVDVGGRVACDSLPSRLSIAICLPFGCCSWFGRRRRGRRWCGRLWCGRLRYGRLRYRRLSRAARNFDRAAAALPKRRRHPEQRERSALEGIPYASFVRTLGGADGDRVDDSQPLMLSVQLRQREGYFAVMRIQQDQQRVAGDRAALFVELFDGVAGKEHAYAPDNAGVPCSVGHLASVRRQPCDVFHAADAPALEIFAPPQHRLRQPEMDQFLRKLDERFLFLGQIPVYPRKLVILAVRVVVAPLR